jgi:hypothetical protein
LPDTDEADDTPGENTACDAGRKTPGHAALSRAEVAHLIGAQSEHECERSTDRPGQYTSAGLTPVPQGKDATGKEQEPSRHCYVVATADRRGDSDQNEDGREPDQCTAQPRELVGPTDALLNRL